MSKEAKKGYGSTLALLSLGVLAFYGGSAWLLVLIPAAVLVWRAATGEPGGKAAIDGRVQNNDVERRITTGSV